MGFFKDNDNFSDKETITKFYGIKLDDIIKFYTSHNFLKNCDEVNFEYDIGFTYKYTQNIELPLTIEFKEKRFYISYLYKIYEEKGKKGIPFEMRKDFFDILNKRDYYKKNIENIIETIKPFYAMAEEVYYEKKNRDEMRKLEYDYIEKNLKEKIEKIKIKNEKEGFSLFINHSDFLGFKKEDKENNKNIIKKYQCIFKEDFKNLKFKFLKIEEEEKEEEIRENVYYDEGDYEAFGDGTSWDSFADVLGS